MRKHDLNRYQIRKLIKQDQKRLAKTSTTKHDFSPFYTLFDGDFSVSLAINQGQYPNLTC
jgi:hypothetical protein